MSVSGEPLDSAGFDRRGRETSILHDDERLGEYVPLNHFDSKDGISPE